MDKQQKKQASDAVYGCLGVLLGIFVVSAVLAWPLNYVLRTAGYHSQYWICLWSAFVVFWACRIVVAQFKR